MSKKLTHIDETGHPTMVDVGGKPITARVAKAECWVHLSSSAFQAVTDGLVPKGDVLRIAELAGIQGAKRTSDLIPLCHPLPIDGVDVTVTAVDDVLPSSTTSCGGEIGGSRLSRGDDEEGGRRVIPIIT